MASIEATCEQCRFWVEDRRDTGECRRRAPIAAPSLIAQSALILTARATGKLAEKIASANFEDPEEGIDTVAWPVTAGDDWCGEFEQQK